MKNNAQVFLVVVGVVKNRVSADDTDPAILFSSLQSAADHALIKLCWRPAAQTGVAKSDFSQMRQSSSDLIENAERFARIELDLIENAALNKLCLSHGQY